MVLNATIMANSNQWKHYSAHEPLIIDRLVTAPGVDMDNLLVGVGVGSLEELIGTQNRRKHHSNFLIEKVHSLKKWNASGFEKKINAKRGAGFTVTTTPHQPIVEPEAASSVGSDELLGALGIDAHDQTGIRGKLSKEELVELLRKHAPIAEAKPETSWQVMHSKNW